MSEKTIDEKEQKEAACLLRLEKVSKSYAIQSGTLDVFKNASLELKAGEIVGLIAPSGAGKSSLLHIAGLLDSSSSGEVFIKEKPTSKMGDKEKTRLRAEEIGFVYQFHHLLPELTALENVILPQRIIGKSKKEATAKAAKLLKFMGLEERVDHRPHELSGGEQQRVAIARAMSNNPAVLLADEPTGNLDPDTAERTYQLFKKIISASGRSALIATHNLELASRMDRCITLTQSGLVDKIF